MIKIRKYAALFAIMPLFTFGLTIGYIYDVAAINEGTIDDGAGDYHYGMDTGQSVEQFLSDAKATEPEAKTAVTDPYMDFIDVQKASTNSENLYKAIFDVWAGDYHVTDVIILVKSDTESFTTSGGSMNAGDHSITTVKVRALDPESIEGKILDWNVNTGS